MNSVELRAIIDRIEEDKAVVLIGDEGRHAIWPLEDLPDGAREGCVIRVIIRLDEDATKHTETIVDSLIKRLERGK